MTAASTLMVLSAAIAGFLGLAHLLITFWGPKLRPRDESLVAAMKEVAPVITSRTTIWKMWMGFNASHSMGLILFGLVYSYLAVLHPDLLFESKFLLAVGLAVVGAFVVLASRYWFRTPLAGACLSLILYLAGVVVAWGSAGG